MSWDLLTISFLNGISLSALLFILASGFTLIGGTMGIVNLSHGSLYMLGAYVGWTVAMYGGNFLLAALLGGIIVGLVGLVIERVILSHMHRQILPQLMATIGLVYVFQNLTLWIWGPHPKMVATPAILSTSVAIGDMSFPSYRFALIIIGLLMAVGLWFFQERTRVGAIVRAGMDDREMVTALGLNYKLTCSAIFSLGAFMAGIAGFIGAPVVGAHPDLGWPMLLLAFVVVVIGGMGSILGASIGAIVVGLADAFGKILIPELAMFMIYLLVVITLLVRPTGLLGRKRD